MIKVLTQNALPREIGGSDIGRLASDTRTLEPVVRVSSRLIAAARRSEYGPRAQALCWVIAVYEDRSKILSFVRPDGGLVVYSGTFRLAETEAGLAALLSHELARALADDITPTSTPCVNMDERPPVISTYQEELVADERGLALMAEAGYDPRELLWLWERMKRLNTDMHDKVLMHVNYDRRMERIAEQLPHALTRYERANRAPQKALPMK